MNLKHIKEKNQELNIFLRQEGNEFLKNTLSMKNELMSLSKTKLIKKFATMSLDEAKFILENNADIIRTPTNKKDNLYVIHYATKNTDIYVLDLVCKYYKKYNIDFRDLEKDTKTINIALEENNLKSFLYTLNFYETNLVLVFEKAFSHRSVNILGFLLNKEPKFNDCLFNCVENAYEFKESMNFFDLINADINYNKKHSLFALCVYRIVRSDFHSSSESIQKLKSCIEYFVSKGCSLEENYTFYQDEKPKNIKELTEFAFSNYMSKPANFDAFMIEMEAKSLSQKLSNSVKSGKSLKI
jgi:hypothetical protein